jgi:hypothetical protein
VIAAPELDELILSFCDEHWRKVARVFSKTMQVLEDRGIQVSGGVADALDARMEVLVRTGRLEAKGDIRECGQRSAPADRGRHAAKAGSLSCRAAGAMAHTGGKLDY